MKKKKLHLPLSALILTLFLAVSGFFGACSDVEARDFYQIKIYSFDSETQEQRLDAYFENAFIPAMHRAGIAGVGVFKPREEDTLTGKQIFVLIPFKTAGEFAGVPELLNQDAKYLAAGKDYIEADADNPPYLRIESILLRSFESMPAFHIPEHATDPSDRVYELRSYQGATEQRYERKVEMFNVAGEVDLFIRLGFQPMFFGEVISGADMPNLIYMTTHANRTAQSENWDAFRTSEDWEKMKALERYKKTVSHIDKYLLFPTDYSDF